LFPRCASPTTAARSSPGSISNARGECYGLLGPNGAGKTTTLRCCLGLTAPDSGDITLVGEPVPERARARRA
jgi:lipooligosaccharide transport system ATP-binding protein